jgi:hypothetical protein
MSSGPVVALFSGPPSFSPSEEAGIVRALEALPDGSVVIEGDHPGMERFVRERAAERGIHVASFRRGGLSTAARAAHDEAAFRLQPDVVYAHRRGGSQTARVVELAHARGIEVRPLGAGRDCEWADLTRTRARAAVAATGGDGSLVVLFSGSRKWRDLGQIEAELRKLPPGSVVIEGDAPGLDRFAGALARLLGFAVASVPALWDFHDKAAGFRRNEAMSRLQPDRLQAFPLDGPGTAQMIEIAEAVCIPVWEPSRPPCVSSPGSVVHCQRASYDVYIGRGLDPHTREPGEWGNRYSHRPSRVPGVVQVASPEEGMVRYRFDLMRAVREGRVSLAKLLALHGKTLGCWCAPYPCHGEVLDAAAMWALTEQARRLAGRVAEMTGRA